MKARVKQTMAIYGYGSVVAGETYEVKEYNSRYVYIALNGKTLQLRRAEVDLIGKPKK